MGSIFSALKNVLGSGQDKRMGYIKKAMKSLGYKCEDHGKYIMHDFAPSDTLRYKSHIVLRPNDEDETINLVYTIYGKRIRHDEPFQSPKSRELIKGYRYQATPDYLLLSVTLDGESTTPDSIAGATKRIISTGLAVYTDAGIPEDPEEGIDFNGVSAKAIKDELAVSGLLNNIVASEECVYGESNYFFSEDKTKLMTVGIRFEKSGSSGTSCTGYFRIMELPLEQVKELAEKFASQFKAAGKLEYTTTGISYTMTFPNGLDKELLNNCVNYVGYRIGGVIEDINNAVLDEYKRRILERMEQEEQARIQREQELARAREAERARGLSQSFTLTLSGDMTVRKVQEYFNEDYPYLRLGFYLVKTADAAKRDGGTITPIESESTLGQIRSFRGECEVSISGDSTPQSLEKEFRSKSGLVIKVCYNDEDDHRYYISNNCDEYKTCIYDLNREFKERGYYKADIS